MSSKIYRNGLVPKWKRRPSFASYCVRETLRIVLVWAYRDWCYGKRSSRPPKWIGPK